MIAEIIIQSNVKRLDKTFDYEIPIELEKKVKIGSRVLVQFGNRKNLEDGFVISIKPYSEYKLKKIEALQNESLLEENKIELAKWMAHRYFCNISDCLKLMLPPGTTTKVIENRIKEKNIDFVILNKSIEEIENDIENKKIKSEKQIRTLKFLMENDNISSTDLEIFADTSRVVINTLQKKGYLEIVQKKVDRNPFEGKNVKRTEKLVLNKEQQNAYETIRESLEEKLFSEFLIFGVTGSRKDRDILTINRKSIKRKQDKYIISSRNIFNTSNCK